MNYLGIDVGSVSLSYVLINEQNKIIKSDYRFHHGNILQTLKENLENLDFNQIGQFGYNQGAAEFIDQGLQVNEQIAAIEGIKFTAPQTRSMFSIGGETFGLFLFDENGKYHKYVSNSSCAAGTGSFLDQQAERLGLENSSKLSELAESFRGELPKIATRCAVFAKTDLIHAQQQGHSLAAISAGLCQGLAQNIIDTLTNKINLPEPVMAVGGVSKNKMVLKYLSEIIQKPIQVPENAVLMNALGSALLASDHHKSGHTLNVSGFSEILKKQVSERSYFFPSLKSELSAYPDFDAHTHFASNDVEIDIYTIPEQQSVIPVYMGIDIGSTSTKAVLTEKQHSANNVILGLYTRTKGEPVKAVQDLLRVLHKIETKYEVQFEFTSVGTTGSGRKFVRKVINADLAIDEITAHARAAVLLNPDTDTIIEIGGQDAKFTVLKKGLVTFSVMNYVCAAGTGSFIEEQAKRLDVPLSAYASRALGAQSPLTSDRCTVFMERDLNHFLSRGYDKSELLAAALHSVRDNYLSKVAHRNKIGKVICFQGATAKNKALVAAFEQKLQKPIHVSRYCHLTGALGVCAILQEQQNQDSNFRGVDFFKEHLRVEDGVCDLCKNHCKLKEIIIGNEKVVWGYLCGRDENDARPKSQNLTGFDLLSSRRHVFTPPSKKNTLPDAEHKSLIEEIRQFDFEKSIEKLKHIQIDFSLDKLSRIELEQSLNKFKENFGLNLLYLRDKNFINWPAEIVDDKSEKEITIGIPNALYMVEYVPFWRLFFSLLGYRVVISSFSEELLTKGKEISAAEFCAPMSNWHGHVHSLRGKCDYIFLPHMLQDGDAASPKFLCHFSNYASAILQNLESMELENNVIDPLINFAKPAFHNIRALYESLPQNLKIALNPNDIQTCFHEAWNWFDEQKAKLTEIFQQQHNPDKAISVVLLGRPYVIMDPVMNKGIPGVFNELGVKTFFQDMIPREQTSGDWPGKELIDWNHWKFGDSILQTAHFIAEMDGLFPVFLTSFKCAPDSFVLSYFKEIMDVYEKPYLVLQLDEHGSSVGYETRIESAVRSFKSQVSKSRKKSKKPLPKKVHRKPHEQGTVLIPNFDPLVSGLVSAAFERAGYQSKLIEESGNTVSSSLRLNDGQCLPVSSIVQGAIEMIEKYQLNPESTSLFLNAITDMACNFPQYPLMAKQLFEQHGHGIEKVRIFATEFNMRSMPYEIIYDVYVAYLLGGFLRKLACKIRPYEVLTGQTDGIITKAHDSLKMNLASGSLKESIFQKYIDELAAVPVNDSFNKRPRVAVIGDMYVRDNSSFNQNLIRDLENYGAEVVTTPLSYMIRMIGEMHKYGLKVEGRYFNFMRDKIILDVLESVERRYFQIANSILNEKFPVYEQSILDELKKFNLTFKHGGETAQNIIKIYNLMKYVKNLAMIIHVNPIFCCAGLVSESFFQSMEKKIGIPIVSIVYDGTKTKRNEALAPYLHFIKNKDMEGVIN